MEVFVGVGRVRTWLAVVWLILNVVLISTVPVASPILPPATRLATCRAPNTVDPLLWRVAAGVLVPRPSRLLVLSQKKLVVSCVTFPALSVKTIDPVANHENTGAWSNVFTPANTWAPVDTSHRAVREALGRLNVWTFPTEEILKSLPAVPIANVWVTPVRPLIEPILLLKIFQSSAERAPVVVVLASARESPVPDIDNPLAVAIYPTLLLKVFQSVAERAPVVVELAILIPKSPVPELYVRGPVTPSDWRARTAVK